MRLLIKFFALIALWVGFGPPALAQVNPYGSECPHASARCTALTGTNSSVVFLIDKARQWGDYVGSGAHGTLSVVSLATGEVLEQYPVGLGCNGGRKRASGDRRTPEGTYHLVQRRQTRTDRSNWRTRWVSLGSLFFLTTYPRPFDCTQAGATGSFQSCRSTAGDLVGLHAGRRSGSCTNGCIRLTGPNGAEDYWLERLDQTYIAGRVTALLIGPTVHDSFYQGANPRCWRERLRDLAGQGNDQDAVIAQLAARCR